MRDVVIVGGGPAGLSAALVASGNGLEVGLVEASVDLGGQLRRADHPVIDMLGQAGVDGLALVARWSAQVASIPIARGFEVTKIGALASKGFELLAADGRTLRARAVVLATGTRARRLGIAGEDQPAREARPQWRGRRVVIVGGGDEATSTAVALATRDVEVTLVVRGRLAARAQFAEEARAHPRIELREGDRIVRVIGERVELASGAVVDAVQVLTRIGVEVVLPLSHPELARHPDGRAVIDQVYETTVPGLYAIGDCTAEGRARYASAAIAQGALVARTIEERLRP